ncbi:MAG TPA: hypothetical protein VF170_18195 [Planctomycetaceae bacterium]
MATTGPPDTQPGPAGPPASPWPEVLSETFPERIAPRDPIDFLLGVFLVWPWVGTAFFALPALLAYGGLRSAGLRDHDAALAGLLAGLAVLIDVALLVHLPAFRSVTLDRDGLLFRRYAGPAKRVSWASLVRVAEASRAEVFLRVWLWPGFPPRGSLLCGSTKLQFRIDWDGGLYYFAPKDVEGFLDALRRRRPDVIAGVRRGET